MNATGDASATRDWATATVATGSSSGSIGQSRIEREHVDRAFELIAREADPLPALVGGVSGAPGSDQSFEPP